MARYTLIAAVHAAGVGRRPDVHELGEPGSPVSEDILSRTARDWIAAQRGDPETLIYVAPAGAVSDEDHPTLTIGPAPATPPTPDPLADEMADLLQRYRRHELAAASHLSTLDPADPDELEELEEDPLSVAQHQAAAAVHAQLALASATALGALATLRASRTGRVG